MTETVIKDVRPNRTRADAGDEGYRLFVRKAKRGEVIRPAFRLPFAPWSQIATLVFLVSVVVLMAFDESGRIVLASVPVIVLVLVVGWVGVRKRIDTSVLEKSA